MRIWLAIRVFFLVLFDAAVARRIREILSAPAIPVAAPPPAPGEAPPPKPVRAAAPPARSEALALLAALQREARFLDIVREPLGQYSDAQIGAAARDVLRNCATVLERFFAPQPALDQEEGSAVEVPKGYDPLRYKLTGNVAGEPPFRGHLVHHGWIATRCELPAWSGGADAARTIAPIEIEIR